VVNEEDNNRSNYGNDEAVKVQTRYASRTKKGEEIAAYNRTDNTEKNIQEESFPSPVDNLAADETGKQAEYDPCEPGHKFFPFAMAIDLLPPGEAGTLSG